MRPGTPCQGCGGQKLPGQGQRYCADCKENADWRRKRKRSTRVIQERHPCLACGGRKEPGHGRQYCVRCAAKVYKNRRRWRHHQRYCRNCQTPIPSARVICDACKLAALERRRQRQIIYRKRNAAKRRRKLSARDRETRRIRYRLNRERAGRPVTRRSPGGWRDRGANAQISAEPLLPLLERRLADTPVTVLGDVARVSPYRLEAIVQGKAATLAMQSADRLCVALGVAFESVYGGTD